MAQQMGDESTTPARERQGLRLGGGAIASLAGGAALVIFMVQNTDDVTVKFLFWDFTWPVWLLILVAALIGALVWFGLGVLRRHRRRVERRDGWRRRGRPRCRAAPPREREEERCCYPSGAAH
jgi:uncharacterized integral membrane protein